jgi:iron(III) transport system permease protein
MSRPLSIFVYLFTAAFFGCFLLWPIGQTVSGAFFGADGKFTVDYFGEVFRNPIYVEGLWNSLLMGLGSTTLAVLIAVPLAFLSDRFEFPGKKWFSSLILVPMILPPFVGAIGVKQIFGQYGAFNALLIKLGLLAQGGAIDWLGQGRLWSIIVLTALSLYPILYLNVVAALANVDPALEEAAENLGCTGLRKHLKITLPLIMPGLFAGGTIVFIWAFTELGVPLIFDFSRITSVQIFNGVQEISGNPFPYALVVVMLTFAALLYAASKWFFGRHNYSMMAKATSQGGAKPAGKIMSLVCIGAFSLVTFLAILPHLGVFLVSFSNDWYRTVLPASWTLDHYHAALGHALTVPSIANSLKYAAAATLFDLFLGIGIAYVVVRSNLPGRGIFDALSMLPLAVPGLVLAFGYISMTQPGHLFSFLNPTDNPTALLIIAYSVRRLPYIVRSAVAGLQQTSETLEEAAQNLGATPFRAICKITLPLITANLLAGGLLAFAFAMLEVSDSLLLAQKQEYFPITKAIYELFQLLGEGRYVAAALGVWAMAFLAITILAATKALGKRLGALFRV